MTPTRFILAGALGLAALAVPASSQPPTPAVTINLSSYRYSPNPIYLAGGVPVRLIFVNRSGKTHDFSAGSFFRSARILSGAVANGEVMLRGGQSAVVTLVPARGTYPVHCTRPFHKMFGMKSTIIVS